MRISDWSSDVCSSDLRGDRHSFEDVLTAMLMPIIHVFSARDRMLYARFMMRLLPLDEDEHPYFKALHLCGPSVEIQRRRSDEHTSELQSLMRTSYAVFCLKKKTYRPSKNTTTVCLTLTPITSYINPN